MKQQETNWQSIKVGDGSTMRVFVARPNAPVGKVPGILVFQEAFGVNRHIRDVAMRIAALGYVAVAPELFHRTAPGYEGDYHDLGTAMPHMQALTNDLLEADIRATHAWLQADAQVDDAQLAAVGYCLGGKAAFIANAIVPLNAAVSYYGSSIPSILHQYAGNQHAPITLFWGGKDKHIDVAQRHAVDAALRDAGMRFTQVEFSDAGHGFFCDERENYHANAASESWAMLAVFLKNHLKA